MKAIYEPLKKLILFLLMIALVMTCIFSNYNSKNVFAKSKIKVGRVSSVTTSSKKTGTITVKYKKVKLAKKYQVSLCTNSKFKKNVKTKYTTKNNISFTKLKSGTYYTRVRAIRRYKGKNYYGAWSKVKKYKLPKKTSTPNKPSVTPEEETYSGFDVSFDVDEAQVGQKIKLNVKGNVYGDVSYVCKFKGYYTYDGNEYVSIDKDYNVVFNKAGRWWITMSYSGDSNHEARQSTTRSIWIYNDTNPKYGFSVNVYSSGQKYKYIREDTTVTDGISTFDIDFESEASEEWLDKHMSFEIADVTPKAYYKAMNDLDLNMTAPTMTVGKGEYSWFVHEYITSPSLGNTFSTDFAMVMGKKTLKITSGVGIRVIKVLAYKDNQLVDIIYVATKPYDADQNYLDDDYYKLARQRIEAKLWTEEMDNYQKLSTLASYISNTTHYPGSGCTKKDINPTLWDNFSVDGIDLYYNMFDMPTLNRIMDLQGGTTTCLACDIITTAACDDLGLPYLYDKPSDTIADGEGVWIGIGSFSSSGIPGGHYSAIYKSADEEKHFIDVQGMATSTSCEEHNCLEHVLSFK